MVNVAALVESSPTAAARALVDQEVDPAWLDAFVGTLETLRENNEVARILNVWGLSQAEFAELMGVSRQAVGKWMHRLPADRAVAIADLAAATQQLVHYVRPERIPAVVRRPASALDDRSLVDLVAAGDTASVLVATRQMFDVSAIAG